MVRSGGRCPNDDDVILQILSFYPIKNNLFWQCYVIIHGVTIFFVLDSSVVGLLDCESLVSDK